MDKRLQQGAVDDHVAEVLAVVPALVPLQHRSGI
jgi:hypothetical protein